MDAIGIADEEANTMMLSPSRVGVYPPEEIDLVRPLVDSLDMVLPVRLLPWDETVQNDFDALLALRHNSRI